MVISQRASSPVSHGPGTSAPSRAYAPTSASICGMLFLPNSTRRVPSARMTTMQGTLIAFFIFQRQFISSFMMSGIK